MTLKHSIRNVWDRDLYFIWRWKRKESTFPVCKFEPVTLGADRMGYWGVFLLQCIWRENIGKQKRNRICVPFFISIRRLLRLRSAFFRCLRNWMKARRKYLYSWANIINCEFDDRGNIGKRYRRQDEIGTPFCVTYDFDSEEDGAVTVRDRDTMEQERVKIEDLKAYFEKKNLSGKKEAKEQWNHQKKSSVFLRRSVCGRDRGGDRRDRRPLCEMQSDIRGKT